EGFLLGVAEVTAADLGVGALFEPVELHVDVRRLRELRDVLHELAVVGEPHAVRVEVDDLHAFLGRHAHEVDDLGWMVGSPPENITTSGSPSEATKVSRPAPTWSFVSENPSGWWPESAKQIGQSRLQLVLTSMIPRHACCLCSGQRPQSRGHPSFTSVWVSSGIVPGLLKRSESKYISASE